jgi:calcium-dependent protein kinase
MKKLISAINHCHANNIAHRDLKPENIMYVGKSDDSEVKIIDFGLSKKKNSKGISMDTVVGTPYYVAPEVLKGMYGFECDMWSLGVIMYILLSGCLPFAGNNAPEVFEKVKSANYTFETKEWKDVSDEAKDLIKQLLTVDVKKRLTAAKAYQHPWLKIAEEGSK